MLGAFPIVFVLVVPRDFILLDVPSVEADMANNLSHQSDV